MIKNDAHRADRVAGVLAAVEPVPEFSVALSRLTDEQDEMRAALTRAEARKPFPLSPPDTPAERSATFPLAAASRK